ncbi:hypothetical protein CONPUDRAFT_164544 [Coniophora puteana RWD-64-598 SS2]|uniref:F-box domain-containing protein n=1 Tax=Coniophora puteana (strain RWD-64-598) TaxID=741705 RepID=A0A5M3MRS1_CONPW|nr:uncharacterized protein CONPUDRAFT_164544 [Coniophora puteana RWD-64-598 SS2]EIW81767.1 hypothetical protein CONPUDRAFT_164544 [Coniophora puteana RWD-64-598 SS2]
MHHALQIVEIVRAICWDVKHSGMQGEPTLVSLAQTCRTFQDPALDTLWEHLYTIDTLIRALPKDAWIYKKDDDDDEYEDENPDLSENGSPDSITILNRPLTPADWAIIRKYAPRVRTLWQARPLSSETFWALSVVPNGMMPLLPNLKDLRWLDKNLNDFPSMRLLLPSSLVTMDCSLKGDPHRVCAQIAALSRMCPRMKDMEMSSYNRIPQAMETFSRALCSWTNITRLRCEEITDDAWIHIASFPRLTELSVSASPATSFRRLRDRMPENPFSSVTSLDFCSVKLDQATEFISETAISPTDLGIHCLHSKSATLAEALINAIVETCGISLKKLTVGYTDKETFISPPPLDSIRQRGNFLTLASLKPLFRFKNLHTLKIDVVCKMDLGDNDIIELAKAFPHLQDLSLNSRFGWQQRSKVTFFGFFSLLSHCPELEEIGIVFDAEDLSAVDPELDTPPERRAPIPAQRDFTYELTVGDSRIGDPEKVAAVLLAVFPCLEDIHSWMLCDALPMDEERAREGMPHYLGWQKVQELIQRSRSEMEDEESGSDEDGDDDSDDDDETVMGD